MSALKRARTLLLIAAGFVAGIAFTFGLHAGSPAGAISFWGQESTPPPPPATNPAAPVTPPPAGSLPDFATLAERLSPAVVNISTSTNGGAPGAGGGGGGGGGGPEAPGQMEPGGPQGPSPFGRDPHEFWEPFERFFGPMPKRRFKER